MTEGLVILMALTCSRDWLLQLHVFFGETEPSKTKGRRGFNGDHVEHSQFLLYIHIYNEHSLCPARIQHTYGDGLPVCVLSSREESWWHLKKAMLSESSLWIMACGPPEDLACVPPECVPRSSPWQGTRRASAATATHTVACSTHCSSAVPRGHSPEKTVRSKDRPSQPGPAAIQDRGPFDRASPEVEVPRQGVSAGDGAPFLGTASCKLICQNYSDLCIRGDQVLPLSSENAEDHLPGANAKTAVAPFLWSCDIDPEPEDAERSFQAGQFLLRRRAGSHQWRQGSGRDLSILFHGRDGPATYSLWNCFLEHKLMHLARDQAGAPCPLLASEFIHTSVDQLTQQLSRERRLEAGLARDMLIGCMLRVASDVQSGEISTPLLQFSEDTATPRAEEALGEEEPDEAAAQRGQDFG